MLLIDLEEGRIISDEEIKSEMAQAEPYQEWLDEQLVTLPEVQEEKSEYFDDLVIRQKSFGYTYEDIHKYLVPVITEGKDPLGSMGNDTPLAVLSDRPQSLFNYFKQLFAQVTNPPIDAIREQLVTSTMTLLGAEGIYCIQPKENIHRIQLETPVLTNDQTDQLKSAIHPDFKSAVISAVFTNDLKADLDRVFAEAEAAINAGASILVLTDREAGAQSVAIPALLAVSGLHQHLSAKRKPYKGEHCSGNGRSA